MTRLAIQFGLLAFSCFGLTGCDGHSSYGSYSVPTNNTSATPAVVATGSPATDGNTGTPNPAGNADEPTTEENAGDPAPAGNYEPTPGAYTRPALAVSQGQYFKWSMPIGWRAYESANGVDLTSPDGRFFANSTLLTG